MGKSTISMVIFHGYFDITRGYIFAPQKDRTIGNLWRKQHQCHRARPKTCFSLFCWCKTSRPVVKNWFKSQTHGNSQVIRLTIKSIDAFDVDVIHESFSHGSWRLLVSFWSQTWGENIDFTFIVDPFCHPHHPHQSTTSPIAMIPEYLELELEQLQ